MKTYDNYNLLNNNTFGISAKCGQFIEIETADEAQRCLPFIAKTTKPLMVIGAGSNLLLTKDFEGIVLRSGIKGIKIENSDNRRLEDSKPRSLEYSKPQSLEDSKLRNPETPAPAAEPSTVLLTAGSGETMDDVIATALSLGYYGMENLSIIPGDVGASAVQNIGAYGAEAADIIESIEAVEIKSGKRVTIPAAECRYAYRQSRFKQEWKGRYFITAVTYRLQTVFQPRLSYGGLQKALEGKEITQPTAADVRQAIIEIRNAKLPDPKLLGNGGSFFMNPIVSEEKFLQLQSLYPEIPYYELSKNSENSENSQTLYKIPAGWMIEQCGWKGKALGRAAVHDKQALVLVNLGNADGNEILNLCNTIQRDVLQKFGIEIHPEVNII